jgi:hypothetical protein
LLISLVFSTFIFYELCQTIKNLKLKKFKKDK